MSWLLQQPFGLFLFFSLLELTAVYGGWLIGSVYFVVNIIVFMWTKNAWLP